MLFDACFGKFILFFSLQKISRDTNGNGGHKKDFPRAKSALASQADGDNIKAEILQDKFSMHPLISEFSFVCTLVFKKSLFIFEENI